MTDWPEPVERVSAVLRAAAVDARIEEFPEGAATAREAAQAIGRELAQIVKSVVLVCDGAAACHRFYVALSFASNCAPKPEVLTAQWSPSIAQFCSYF